MEKVLAKKILPLVNDVEKYPLLQDYIENRIETMRNFLENTKDHTKLTEVQLSLIHI